MSYLDWKVGDKVVCIVGGGHRFHNDAVSLVKGATYTLRELHINPKTGNLNVVVEEVRNTERYCTGGFMEPQYAANRFRPVQKRTTSIEIFTALLNPSQRDREYIELEDLEHSEVPFR